MWDAKTTAYANQNVRIRRCVAYRNPGDPNYMANHSGSGIFMDDTQDGRIDRCVAYGNGFQCNTRVGGPCGIWTHASDRIVISRCVSVNNRTGRGVDGAGFDFDAGVSNSVLHHNVSGFNDGAGYLLYVYPNAPHRFENNVCHHNLSVNDGRKNDYGGFFIRNDGAGVRNTRLHHNRIYQTPSPNRQSSGIYLGNTIGTELYKNTFVTRGDVPLLRIKPNHTGLTIHHNSYQSLTDSLRIDMNIAENNKTTMVPADVPVFRDVRQWSRETGYEQQNGHFIGRRGRPNLRFVRRVERLAERYR